MDKIYNSLTLLLIALLISGFVTASRVRRIVGGQPADVASGDDPVVFLRYAGRSARIRGALEFPHYHFRGIRYAYSPTGRDRFQRPRKYFLDGEYNATSYPPPCIQSLPGNDFVIGSEDCLFLNVFTPNLPDGTEGLPVVVWIHGGGFRHGSSSQYGARHLVDKRLILVTIQYRLGTLGFLSAGNPELPGNAGIFDMALAVEWVRNHVGFFGGNPHRIVVMGHGTGASSALLLALSDIAKGVASGVVAMSGTAVSHWAVDDTPSETAKEVAEYHGCPTTSVLTMVRCLQNVPAAVIVKGDSHVESTRLQSKGFLSGLSGLLGTSPVTEGVNDGRSLPAAVQRKPLDDMYFGRTPKIPLLTGITRDETKKAVEGRYKDEAVANMKSIPHFLDDVLVKTLQKLTGLGVGDSEASNFWNVVDPLGFRAYIGTTRSNVEDGLGKISEATGDALFNLPAFLTADLWSKQGASTYLYRFEHCGQAPKGDVFLKGTPIIGNNTGNGLNDTVGHGDDLAYLFEPRDVDGTILNGLEMRGDDKAVREVFTQMIADFAYHGQINVNNEAVPGFSSKSNNFIQIGPKPKVAGNFRYCQMALWAGLAERLQSTSCQFLNALNTNVGAVKNVLFDTGLSEVRRSGEKLIPLSNPIGRSSKKSQLPFGVFS